MRIGLIAGHHRAFYYHGRDPGAIPPNEVKRLVLSAFPNEPIYNEHHEAEKLVSRAMDKISMFTDKDGLSDRTEVMLCPFRYNLRQKKKWAKMNKIDWIIAVHLNSAAHKNRFASGSEVWVNNKDTDAKISAQKAARILADTQGNRNRGAKYSDRLYILHTDSHELLLEMGFITNHEDMIRMRKKGADAIVTIIKHIDRTMRS